MKQVYNVNKTRKQVSHFRSHTILRVAETINLFILSLYFRQIICSDCI